MTNNANEALEACPFCGGEATLHKTRSTASIRCSDRLCLTRRVPISPIRDASAMVAAWNRRAPATVVKQNLTGEGEVERLKLDLAAQECLQDSAYKAGVKLGWNLCVSDDEAGYQRVMAGTEHIAELKRVRQQRQALASGQIETGV